MRRGDFAGARELPPIFRTTLETIPPCVAPAILPASDLAGKIAGATRKIAGATRKIAGATRKIAGATRRIAGATPIVGLCTQSGDWDPRRDLPAASGGRSSARVLDRVRALRAAGRESPSPGRGA